VKPFLLLMLLSLLVPAIGQESGSAQSKNAVVGTWKLVSATETTKKGEVRAAYGWQNPAGLLTYTADGRIMAITTNGRRKPLSVSDNIGAPAEERAEAFATMTAYAGSYTLNGNRVIHHIEVSSMPNAVNTDQVRLIHQPERQLLDPANAHYGECGRTNRISRSRLGPDFKISKPVSLRQILLLLG